MGFHSSLRSLDHRMLRIGRCLFFVVILTLERSEGERTPALAFRSHSYRGPSFRANGVQGQPSFRANGPTHTSLGRIDI